MIFAFGHSKKIRLILLVCAAGLAGLAAWLLFGAKEIDRSRVYRMGYGNDAPFHFKGPDGLPSGLAVQIVSEAARRRGIKLQWMEYSDSHPQDFWVLMTIVPDRRKKFHFTDPYLQTESFFVTLTDSKFYELKDLTNARISYIDFGIHRKVLGSLLPGHQPVPVETSRDALAKVISGAADAAYLDQYSVLPALLEGDASRPLRLIYSHAPIGLLALASTFESAPVADEIRSAMTSMADDGTLSAIVARWGSFPNLTTDMIGGLVTAQRRARWLAVGLATLSTFFLISLWLAARSRSQARDLRRAGRSLKQSEAQSRAMLEVIPDLMFRLSREGIHLDFHAGSSIQPPINGSAYIDKNVRDLYPAGVADLYLRHAGEALGKGGIQLFEYSLAFAPLEERFFEARMVPCGPGEVLAIVRDITPRKRAEEERAQLESQIQQTRKIESIGLLAGGIAHDFNNILAAIMMRLDLARALPNLSPDTEESLKHLALETQRAASLTQQLLMFSRQSAIQLARLDLNELAAMLIRMLGRLVGGRVAVQFDRCSGPAVVEGDAGMLQQVILNLSLNARDAMPGGGLIIISTAAFQVGAEQCQANPEAVPGLFYCLSVSDNGCGMDEATRMRLFEPFFTTKEPGKGTGLGLATVYGIVIKHRGWIEVVTAVGQGSTFKVFIPAA